MEDHVTARLASAACLRVAVLAIGSCSSGDTGNVDIESTSVAHDQQSILNVIGAESRDGGRTWSVASDHNSGCMISGVLTDAAAVKAALDARESVAVNPAKTIGLIVIDKHKSACVKH